MKRYIPTAYKIAGDKNRILQIDQMIPVDVGIEFVKCHIPAAGQIPTQNDNVFQIDNAVFIDVTRKYAANLAYVRLQDLQRQIKF